MKRTISSDASSVGQVGSQIVLGKHSGRNALARRFRELGYEVTTEELDRTYAGMCEQVRVAIPALGRVNRWPMADREPLGI